MIAASILAIAALAAMQLLATSDASGLFARRQALAALEAERALVTCAEAAKTGQPIPSSATLSANLVGEALMGCSIRVTTTLLNVNVTVPGPGGPESTRTIPIKVMRLVAEVLDPDGGLLVTLERPAPVPDDTDG